VECGDVLAALEYAMRRGLIRQSFVLHWKKRKLKKLLDPKSKNNVGRRLAP